MLGVIAAQSVAQEIRALASAMVSPMSAKIAGLVFGNGWASSAAPAQTLVNSPSRPCDRPDAGVVAAVAAAHLAGPQLQPVLVARRDAPAARVEHADRQRHVGRHFHFHGAVRLHHGVAENLTHADTAAARAEGGAVEIAHGAVGDRDRLLDAQEACGPLVRRRLCGIGEGGDVGTGDTVHVIDAADLQEADALGEEIGVELTGVLLVEDHGRGGRATRARPRR